ncbi:Cocaine esterase [Fusarium oxysporum f. sp. conglutinans]|nr:Cocaine esterase [Fusarium oxysporum f. sp. conglutinans]
MSGIPGLACAIFWYKNGELFYHAQGPLLFSRQTRSRRRKNCNATYNINIEFNCHDFCVMTSMREQVSLTDKFFPWKPSVGPKEVFPAFDASNRQFTDTEYGMSIELNHDIPLRYGVKLRGDVFRPLNSSTTKTPVVLAITPYGKQSPFDITKVRPSKGFDAGFDGVRFSKYVVFEGSDPVFWTKNGFAYVAVDARGSFASEGEAITFVSCYDGLDAYDVIEYLGTRPWSNGHVGMIGASALGAIQWQAAALQPPHLSAIMVQDGWTCLYRELAWKGGVLHPNFMRKLNDKYMSHGNRVGSKVVDLSRASEEHPYIDEFWRHYQPAVQNITCAVYAISSLADNGIHTPGTIRGYLASSSQAKYLELHPFRKWEWQLTDESLERQLCFFNRYLDGPDRRGAESVDFWPRVRLNVTEKHNAGTWRSEDEFPLARTVRTRFSLSRSQELASIHSPTSNPGSACVTYTANSGSVYWQKTFSTPTEITGTSRLHLKVATIAKDTDLFVTLQKLDRNGNIVYFPYHTFINDGHVAWGWLRASKRKLAPEESKIGDEVSHTYLEEDAEMLQPQVPVEMDIGIQPSSTLFRAGETLRVVVQGHDFGEYSSVSDVPRAGSGINGDETNSIFLYDSYLEVPVVPSRWF